MKNTIGGRTHGKRVWVVFIPEETQKLTPTTKGEFDDTTRHDVFEEKRDKAKQETSVEGDPSTSEIPVVTLDP